MNDVIGYGLIGLSIGLAIKYYFKEVDFIYKYLYLRGYNVHAYFLTQAVLMYVFFIYWKTEGCNDFNDRPCIEMSLIEDFYYYPNWIVGIIILIFFIGMPVMFAWSDELAWNIRYCKTCSSKRGKVKSTEVGKYSNECSFCKTPTERSYYL